MHHVADMDDTMAADDNVQHTSTTLKRIMAAIQG